MPDNVMFIAMPCLALWRITQNAYFLLQTQTKQLLLVTVCDSTASIEASFLKQQTITADVGQRTGRYGS